MKILEKIPNQIREKELTPFNVGDTVKVHQKIIEGDKERVQIFSGIVIVRR